MNNIETLALGVVGGVAYVGTWLSTSRMFYTKWRAVWMDKAIKRFTNQLIEGGHPVEITEDHLDQMAVNYRKTEAQWNHQTLALFTGALWPVVLTVYLVVRNPQPSLMEARVHQEIQKRRIAELERDLDAELKRSADNLGRQLNQSDR